MRPDLLYLRALSCFLSAADASLNDWPSSPVVMSAAMRRSSSVARVDRQTALADERAALVDLARDAEQRFAAVSGRSDPSTASPLPV